MTQTLTRKPKAAKSSPRTIVSREIVNGTIYYYIRQGEHVHEVKIIDSVASCNCHAYLYSARGNKRCGDTDLAQRNEQERGTDLQQHVKDDIHSCIYCGIPMKVDGVCGRCQ